MGQDRDLKKGEIICWTQWLIGDERGTPTGKRVVSHGINGHFPFLGSTLSPEAFMVAPGKNK